MAYTVKKLSKLAGVSVRALHFYDEIGLLKPAEKGENGYRFYGEPELLRLQQILFYRELGFPLSEIHALLERPEFDRIKALQSHRRVLEDQALRTRDLIETLDKTIAKLRGGQNMSDQELFKGFDPVKQDRYEDELMNKWGEPARKNIEESKRRMKGWSKDQFEKVKSEGGEINSGLVKAIERGLDSDTPEVQSLIARHHAWVCHFWTPNREAYTALGRMYVDHPDFRKFYDPQHPRLAEYLAAGMAHYATIALC